MTNQADFSYIPTDAELDAYLKSMEKMQAEETRKQIKNCSEGELAHG